jgi:hypothetical protein
MFEVARFGVFAAFLAIGLVASVQKDVARRRFAVNVFLGYTLTVSLLIGFFQLDAWPFSTYRLANQTWRGAADRVHSKVRFFGLDASGREWEIDPSAWSPIYPVVLQFYFRDVFPKLSPAERRRVGAFLKGKAEQSRRALSGGRRFGNERLLGRFAAPDWAVYARYHDVPEEPWSGIRVYREYWRPAERLRDPSRFVRRLELEYSGS